MRSLRCGFMVVLFAGLVGCGFVDSQLARPDGGGDSKLEAEVKAVAPVAGPYGSLAMAAATLLTGVYAAFRSHRADVQTDAPKA
jgi:hypothetical protein